MKSVVGIELGKETIKLLRVDFKGKTAVSVDYHAEDIDMNKHDLVGDQVAQMIAKQKSNKLIVLFLPRNQVTVRNIHLPSDSKSEIGRMIDLHIGRIVPYKKEDVVYNYMSCGNDKSGYTRVMLAIAHNDMIKEQLRSVDSAGILADCIVLSSCGVHQYITNFLSKQIEKLELFIILDIDKSFADFMVASKKSLLFTRTIQKSGVLEEEEAVTHFLGQIRQSLVIFNNEEVNTKPEKIFLTGEFQAGLVDKLEKELDIEVVGVVDPIKTQYPNAKIDLQSKSSQMSLASLICAKFKSDLVFEVPEIAFKKALKEKIRDVTILSCLVLYFLCVFIMLFFVRLSSLNEYVAKLSSNSDEIEQTHGEIITNIDKINIVSDILENREKKLWVIYNIQKLIPEYITLNYFSLESNDKIIIKGSASASSQVFEFVNVLNSYQEFNSAEALYTRQRRDKGAELTDFEIHFLLG